MLSASQLECQWFHPCICIFKCPCFMFNYLIELQATPDAFVGVWVLRCSPLNSRLHFALQTLQSKSVTTSESIFNSPRPHVFLFFNTSSHLLSSSLTLSVIAI